jgi:hypothetical protein
VAIKVDSSGAVERFAHTRSDPDSIRIAGRDTTRVHFTDAEPQAVPSRDGGRVLWTSNWNRDCNGDCGSRMEFKDYVLDARCGIHRVEENSAVASADDGPSPDASPSLTSLPNPFTRSTTIQFELRTGSMVRLELFDAQGRRVREVANSFFPAGRHALSWGSSWRIGRDGSARHLRVPTHGRPGPRSDAVGAPAVERARRDPPTATTGLGAKCTGARGFSSPLAGGKWHRTASAATSFDGAGIIPARKCCPLQRVFPSEAWRPGATLVP